MITDGRKAARSGMKRGSPRKNWITNEAFCLNGNLAIMSRHLLPTRAIAKFPEHPADPNASKQWYINGSDRRNMCCMEYIDSMAVCARRPFPKSTFDASLYSMVLDPGSKHIHSYS